MKKTIIALMAMAGVAMANETLTFSLDRDGTSVVFTEASEIISLDYIGWEYAGTGSVSLGEFETPTNEAYQNHFTPKAQLQSGKDDSWTMKFSVTNDSAEAITLTQFTFDCFGINGGGSDKSAEIPVTLTLGDVSAEATLGKGGAVKTATLGTGIEIGAYGSVELSLTMGSAVSYNTYSGITAGSITYTTATAAPAVPEPTTATLSLLALAGLAARRRR